MESEAGSEGSSSDSEMSESSVSERLEFLVDKVIKLMKKIMVTGDANEREGLHTEILTDMDEATTLMNTPDPKIQLNVASYVLGPPNCRLQVIYSFLHECFAAIGMDCEVESESAYAGGHLSCLLNCIVGWTNVSKELRHKVVHDGYLFSHIEQLAQLSSDEENEFVRCVAGNTIGIIWNCVQESMRPYRYSVMWNELLEPWMKSPYPEIRLQCKFVLGQLYWASAIIPDDSLCLEVDEEDMKLLFSLLNSAVHSPDLMTQQFEWEFSALELIVGSQCISLNPKNLAMMLSSGISSLLLELLQKADTMINVEVCKLLWSLMDSSDFQCSFNLDLVKDLDKDENLKILSTSLEIASLLKSNSSFDIKIDSTKCLTFMQGCHLTKRYKECISIYDTFVDKLNDLQDLKKANFLKAKALYNVYIDEQMQLHENAEIISPKDFSQKLEECYKKVRELIILLGEFLDDPTYTVSDEICIMLDSAMMDYIHETNRLHEITRCYLCQKKTASKDLHEQLPDDVPNVTGIYENATFENVQSVTEGADNSFLQELTDKQELHHPVNTDPEKYRHLSESSTTSDKLLRKRATSIEETDAEQNLKRKTKYSVILTSKKHYHPTTQRKNRLIKSHLFPKAILERFAHAVPLPNNARVINSNMPGLAMKRKYKHHLISPRKSALFMLCSACENTLSGHGESQFIPQFFDKLYDTVDPSKSTDDQVIKYSVELYNFCIGMIFRTLYWSKGKYTNENELYLLLQNCRQYLLNVQSGSLPDPKGIPDIFILISPLSADESELSYGFMNSVLSGTCLAITANSSLSTGEISPNTIIQAQYFLIHIGAINILVKLAPSKDVELPMEFRINPQGGYYNIPHELTRKAYLPQGMWSLFQLLAQMNEKQWLEASESQYGCFENKALNQPATSAAIAYGITSGRDTELNSISMIGLQPSPDPNIPKVINFLPDPFFVRPFQQKTLQLPPGHRILLHETAGDTLSGNTIFIAVGTEGASYSVDKPYVIWHYYNQGIQINFGFLITMGDNGLKAGEFLVSTDEKIHIEDFPEVMQTRNNASTILPGVFQAKGFFNLQSLLNRLIVLRQNLSVIDLKCSIVNDSQCWYCDDLCNSCLKRVSPTINEVAFIGERAIEFKLCSENCCKRIKKPESNSEDFSQQVYVLTPGGKIHSNCSDKFILSQQELHDYCGLRCAPILPVHEEIVHLYSVTVTNNQWCTFSIEEISICHGDITGVDCKYAVYFKRGLSEQPLSFEFFVSPTFEPTQLLPYYDSKDEASSDAFDKLKTSINIQHLLTAAGIHISCQN